MSKPEIERIRLLGVRVDCIGMGDALTCIEDWIAGRKPHQIVTINPEFIMAAQTNQTFTAVLQQADLALADGVGVVWAARLLRYPVPERIPGVDLLWELARLSHEHGYSIFLLGAALGVAEEAARKLQARYPQVCIVGVYAGSPAPSEEAAIVTRVTATHPDILCVAYGAPQQDLWIARTQSRLGIPVAIGIGGALDYIAGRAKRAPLLLRRLGLEWSYRLLHEPWRWRRMLALPRFAWRVITTNHQ